jgi:hypothetical protein
MAVDQCTLYALIDSRKTTTRRFDMTLKIPSEDVRLVKDTLRCNTPEALQITLDTLRSLGYTIEDLRDPFSDFIKSRRVTVKDAEKRGFALWRAHLDNIRYGKCLSCSAHITTLGIEKHGRTCESCGATVYLALVQGSAIRFGFQGDEPRSLDRWLQMRVKRWEHEEGWLYLYRTVDPPVGHYMDQEQAEAYLAKHSEEWEAIEEDGQQLIKVQHPLYDSSLKPEANKSAITARYIGSSTTTLPTSACGTARNMAKMTSRASPFQCPSRSISSRRGSKSMRSRRRSRKQRTIREGMT